MPGSLQVSPEALYFEQVATGNQSQVQTATLINTGTELVTVSTGILPINFLGRYSGDLTFVPIIGTASLGKVFISGSWYFQDTDGTMTTDPAPTGVPVGKGQSDGTLLVMLEDFLQDEDGYPLEAESGDGLIADPVIIGW